MRIAVMQPYIFPYMGYFQMIHAVDKFVFYDDVNFIKRGWINRNRILVNKKDCLFTVPLKKASQHNLINESFINNDMYSSWRTKFLETLQQNYKKSPCFNQVFPIIESILGTHVQVISDLAMTSILQISAYIGIQTEFIVSSQAYQNQSLNRSERLINICKQEGANHYINAIGGVELYQKDEFKKHGIQLNFIKSLPIQYKQFNNEFVPWLSIIDVMMFNKRESIISLLDEYELL